MRGNFDSEKMRLIPVRAHVEEVEVDSSELREAVNSAIQRASADTAAVSLIGDNEKPRMLKITAWIAHGGKPNRNRQAFVAEDLEKRVAEGLFRAPYFGMVDFNHDFDAYGVWYKAEYLYDDKAGEYGILAEGAIFAWRYQDLADKTLAMMSRQGFVEVSMACQGLDYEFAEDDAGYYEIIRNPVFFTTSVLDVPPADKNARGLATEDEQQSSEERKQELLTASADTPEEDNIMDEKLLEAINAAIQAAAEENRAALTELVAAATELPGVKAALETAEASVKELTEKLEAAESTKDEAEVKFNAINEQLEKANEELEALRKFKQEIDEANAEKERTERIEARVAELPESVAKALADMDEAKVERMKNRWAEMDDEVWADTLEGFKAAAKGETKKETLEDKSRREGLLILTADMNEGEFAIDKLA
jgi:hypothetical protein